MVKVVGKNQVTSIRIDEKLWKKAKMYAIEHDMTLREVIESLLKEELNKTKK